MKERPRVGVVSLGEAGNFGDDLILIAAVQAIDRAFPEAEVEYLSFGERLDWEGVAETLGLSSLPSGRNHTRDIPGTRSREKFYENRDVVVFGGGGLLQTSHHPDRPYHWLGYLPPSESQTKVLAVGLGLGPISPRWCTRLSRLGSPFDAAFVRDQGSKELARKSLGWDAELCTDFVDDQFLAQFITPSSPLIESRRIGVALRFWPGLTEERVANHITEVAIAHNAERIDFFVLESKSGSGVDRDFTEAVRKRIVGVDTAIQVYEGHNLRSFIESMMTCEVAISMKLHSSAVWATRGIAIYPIVYAPKIAAFFDLEYRGLEIVGVPTRPSDNPIGAPRSASIIETILPKLINDNPSVRSGFSAWQRYYFQVRSLVIRIQSLTRAAGKMVVRK